MQSAASTVGHDGIGFSRQLSLESQILLSRFPLLGGPWVVINGVISPQIWLNYGCSRLERCRAPTVKHWEDTAPNNSRSMPYSGHLPLNASSTKGLSEHKRDPSP